VFPIIAYIIGCFLIALTFKGRAARWPSWILLGSCVLLCTAYLVKDQMPLAGFSLSTLWARQTASDGSAVPGTEETPATREIHSRPSWLVKSSTSLFGARFSELGSLGGSSIAAGVGAGLYLIGILAILVQPRYGLYAILFFSLLGDVFLHPWYPFVKAFSARESLFFVHDAFIVSPLELYVLLTAISWFAQQVGRGQLNFFLGRLFWPTLFFLAFLLFGLAHGIGTGGDLRIALWEARAIFYLVALMVLASNLVETTAHVSHLIWIAMMALLIKGSYASLYYLLVLQGDLSSVRTISDHAAAIQLNSLFVLSLAVWVYDSSRMKRALLPLMIPFVVLGYIAMQRRAAFITLAIAVILLIALLYQKQRRIFGLTLAILSVGYLAIFWHSYSLLAVPAQAIKSAIVGEQASNERLRAVPAQAIKWAIVGERASDEDQRSNDYRVIENRNINFTIHQHPFAGVGFGQKFYIIAPMPDISWFEWWEYITHNSIMWIWMKAGIGGFFSILFLIGLTVFTGVRTLHLQPDDDLSAVILTATLYIMMHFIFACVDISWTAQSMVYVGTMMGLVNSTDRIRTLVTGKATNRVPEFEMSASALIQQR
jgi:O-antigen ligase/polysaccharide polymerase Wzy-like membrane protein